MISRIVLLNTLIYSIFTAMKLEIVSLRTFIGSKNFDVSKSFYSDLGFKEVAISKGMSLFERNNFSFYLQDYYVKQWIDNTALFIEVKDVAECFEWLIQLELDKKYSNVKIIPIKKEDWGEECFVIDPSGVLLHFGEFYRTI
jgi:hypothetical protein